jgi:hypothetical protein
MMASAPSLSTPSLASWSPSLQEALELDISIMEALLRRNRCSFQRCKYYQRLKMAERAIQRDSFLPGIQANLQSFRDDLQAERQRRSMKKRRRDDDFWVLSTTHQAAIDSPAAVLFHLHGRLHTFAAQVNEYFCQSVSRLEHASIMLFIEIARGFFLPFCTVAVAAVARVRTLMSRLCLNLTTLLLEVAADIKKDLSSLENAKDFHLDPLWTPAQISTFQEHGLWLQQLPLLDTESSASSNKAVTAPIKREQHCRTAWKSLGIPARKPRQVEARQVSSNQEGMGATDNDDSDKTSPLLAADDKDDIGQAVGLLEEDAMASSVALDGSNVAGAIFSGDIDLNLSLVQELQTEKKRKKSKEQGTQRAAEDKKKKKKKAKAKKADFFDDLFT